MSKPDPRKLTCNACNHENEIERVYCHNCGEKLDRSLLPKLDETKSAEEQAKAGRQVKKMMNPNRFAWAHTIRTFALIEILAAVVAAVFLAVQAPENVPPMKTDRISEKMIGDEWTGMMNARPWVSVAFKEFDLNDYLRKTVKSSEGPLGIKFERAFTILEPGLVTVATQRSAWGLAIYNSVTFEPKIEGGKWGADVQRIAFGRLTIPASVAKLTKLDTLVQGALTKVFEKEIQQLNERVEKIEVGTDVISFKTRPRQ